MNFDNKEDLFDYINELTNKIEALENSLAEKGQEESKEQEQKQEQEQEQEINEIDNFLNKKGVNA